MSILKSPSPATIRKRMRAASKRKTRAIIRREARLALVKRNAAQGWGEKATWEARLKVIRDDCEHPEEREERRQYEVAFKCADCGQTLRYERLPGPATPGVIVIPGRAVEPRTSFATDILAEYPPCDPTPQPR